MKKTVLLVDDDPDILDLLKLQIEKSGRYAVVLARSGRDGIHKAKSVAPDLIVCDIDMPDLDGGAVVAALSEERSTAGIPVLFLSSMVEEQQAASGDIGGWPMLSKRSTPQHMIARIDALIRSAPAA